MATTAVSHTLRFDNYELDTRAGQLRKGGVKLRLRGQPLQVLAILVEHAGEVVTREELQQQIWTADTFVDFDHGLHNAIARIREVLGDSAETPRYIETLPRRGYRFIGTVEDFRTTPSAEESGAPVGQPVTVSSPPKRKPGPVLVLCALLLLGLAVWTVRRYVHAKAAAQPIRSIAVLPLANLSGDPSEEFFADGMTDQLITDLAQIGSLRIISRTSVMQYKSAKKALPEIARELNVDAIVEGSVVRSGPRVRVTAQLVQARSDQHLWADTYDRDLGDVLKLQGEVADAIAQQVRAQLTASQSSQLRQGVAVNPAAYDAYLRGRIYFVNGFFNPEALHKAQSYFEASLQQDPNFALPYAGMADSYVYLAFVGAMPRDQAYRSAKAMVAKALQLDDTIGEAHDTLGLLDSQFDWDWNAADREFSRAIALAPSYSCAHEDRAMFLAMIGRRADALAEIKQIDQLDYGPIPAGVESFAYSELRDYPALIGASQRALLLDPNDWSEHYRLGVGYEGTGKLAEAIAEYQKAAQVSGDSQSLVALAHAYASAGKKAEAQKILHELERKAKQNPASPYTMATIYAGLGETDKAFSSLEEAYATKSISFPSWLVSDLTLDGLRPDPRFQSLLARMGLKN
ncbi:MAG TPA: winged helix-turn-helix domain-containing protein [Candidatus Binatia bacterium]|nr:winged helix-turn-helix domain-containing protein [Candidatus Binatia bacterium]